MFASAMLYLLTVAAGVGAVELFASAKRVREPGAIELLQRHGFHVSYGQHLPLIMVIYREYFDLNEFVQYLQTVLGVDVLVLNEETIAIKGKAFTVCTQQIDEYALGAVG